MIARQQTILPTECIGILGGGQLGRMLAMVARQMGYQVAILEPSKDCPAAPFANHHITKPYDSQDGLLELAKLSRVVTTEFENVPAASIRLLKDSGCEVYPDENSISIAQNRGKEKSFFRSIGLETAEFKIINNQDDIKLIGTDIFPAILKTTTLGYDGKGQIRVKDLAELVAAYQQLGGECILEKLVDLAYECSVIVARNQTGAKCFPLIENYHRDGILDISYIPANLSEDILDKANKAAMSMVEALDYIGILTIEFFVTTDNRILVNEIAPRPHNSGHITIESCITSQFEQQLRAVCGLPLGDTEIKIPGAMLNLLGDVWLDNRDAFAKLCADANAKFHWYEKLEAKKARKMGHLSLTDTTFQKLESRILEYKQLLRMD
jgi:5-(carboxyamino)imidazole ribonucleotide synthase